MSISSPFIVRPIATSLLMVAIFLSGVLSYQFLPVSSLPEIDYPIIEVVTAYPGASPKVMASSVTAPLERQFGQMPGLNQMTSTSTNGLSLITLLFDLGLSLDVAEQEVQAAINAAAGYLPTGLPNPPVYAKVNPADAPIITLAVTSKTMSLAKVEDLAETRLAQKISQISGVGLVSVTGGQRPAVRIQANPRLLAAHGLSTTDIRNAVSNANVNAAKGSFDGDTVAYAINANDQLLTSAEYSEIVITYQNNAAVKIKDVAKVIDDVENTMQAAWVNKEPAIIINIQRQPGANVIKVADTIKAMLPKLSASLPGDINLSVLSDRTTTIRSSVADVEFELTLSIALVILVMYCFFRNMSATIIPSITVPLSLVGTLGVMYLLGFSLNNLTLMSLTIATGFVVDDAIVMIENIARYLEKGEKPLEAALKGASQIGFTIMSLTISLIAVLIPLFFMEDVIGRLFREFAITLTITIIVSAFISLTLTPMLCAKMLKADHGNNDTKLGQWLESSLDKLISGYGRTLKIVLANQSTTMVVAIITFIITGMLFYFIPKGFFPVQDTGMIQAISEVRADTSFSSMVEKQAKLAEIVLADKDVESLSSFIGIDGTNITLNSGRMLINLKDMSKRKSTASEIIKRLQAKLNMQNAGYLYLRPIQDLAIDSRVSKSEYQYSINSHDSDEVSKYSALLVEKLSQSPKLIDVTSDQENHGLETYIEINRDNAARVGISVQNVVDGLYDVFGQRQITTMFTERNQYHVILEGLPNMQMGVGSLDNIYIKSASNAAVPLLSIVKVTSTTSPLVIARQNQFPVSTVSFGLNGHTSLGAGLSLVEKAKKELNFPEHIMTSFQGTAQAFANSAGNEGWLIVAAVVVVYIVLGVLYESYIHPITILSTLPSACMGALLALLLCGKDLDVISIIGIILLIGIVKKNAIMMIDFALEQQRSYNKSAQDAIFEAAILRFRPILMTTMAALLGAVPLVLGGGMGSEIRAPLGITIIGGLTISQVLTLYTTPVIYLAFDRLLQKFTPKHKG
jgi:multidrug efflux pump